MSYINGSDLLVMLGEKAGGHCTSHTTTYNSETKDRAVKPLASVTTTGKGLFKEKTVTGINVSIKFEGLRFQGEEETGFKELLAKWKVGATLPVKAFFRGSDTKPYLSGNFVIASLEESAPAGDDVSYNGTFENTGEVTIDETLVDGQTSTEV